MLEIILGFLVVLLIGWLIMDIVIRILKGPYHCSCGFKTMTRTKLYGTRGMASMK